MFYATDGTLTTSYDSLEKAQRYRAGAHLEETERYLNMSSGVIDIVGPQLSNSWLVRSSILSNAPKQGTGKFKIIAQETPSAYPVDTGFRFEKYGDANNAMKLLAQIYAILVVVEEK